MIEVTPPPVVGTPSRSVPAKDDAAGNDWGYETLSAEERAVVDRGRDVAGWEGVHQAFSAGAPE